MDRIAAAVSQLRSQRPRGAALVVAMVLLLVLTILAFTGLNTSITENLMANNEQFRRSAAQAAAAGIERAIADLRNVPTTRNSPPVASGWRSASNSPADLYHTQSQYRGEERNLPQSSADKFVGLHFAIDSDGASARNSRDRQTQGVFVIAPTGGGGGGDFGQIGTGLAE
jgi:type II secretory pathway pseudopilin PulG